MKKERIESLDFIRGVSALLIVLYHTLFIFQSNAVLNCFPIKAILPNGDWSVAVVSVFFMLSGASLYYNYPKLDLKDLKTFYFKRWKSLFPAFLLVWFYNYFLNVVVNKDFFYGAEPKYLLLSLIGMDGYFHYLHDNYYYAGEWFLGAIIILYLLYPIVLKLFEKPLVRYITTGVITVAFFWLMVFNPFLMNKAWNPITCLFTFWFGMIWMENRKFFHSYWWMEALCIIPLLALLFSPHGMDPSTCMVLASLFAYPFMDVISGYIFKVKVFKKFILLTGALSYEIFLVHHTLMYDAMNIIVQNNTYHVNARTELAFVILILVPIYFYAKALSLLIKAFFNTALWRKIEGFFTK